MSYDEYGDYNGYAPAAAEHYVRTILQIYFRTFILCLAPFLLYQNTHAI